MTNAIAADTLATAAQDVLQRVRTGDMASTAYDTAWAARLRNPDGSARFPRALQWLLARQHEDGSWGGAIGLPHDRVISTLAAIAALARHPGHERRIANASAAIAGWAEELESHPSETVAFELLAPTLLQDCLAAGAPVDPAPFAFVEALRQEKLRRIPPEYVYHQASPLAFSLEHRGADLDLARVQAARGATGSYGNSPSATAYVLERMHDPAALAYLQALDAKSLDGGFCNVQPFDVFEHAWVLYNLQLAGLAGQGGDVAAFLRNAWTPDGVGWNSAGIQPDCDDTALAIAALIHSGERMDAAPLARFATETHFLCYFGERTTCATANIHALDALALSPDFPTRSTLMDRAASFLRATQRADGSWMDKWHASPFYPVGHALIALNHAGLAADCARPLEWLLETQQDNGAWGFGGGTSEETAYAVLGLAAAGTRPGHAVAAQRGAAYLRGRLDEQEYPPLWIGKGLYTPRLVVRSAVIAAIRAGERRDR